MSKLSGDHVQVLVDSYEITGDSNHISINDNRNVLNATAFGDEVHKFVAGQRMMAVQHAGFMNGDEAGSHPALKGVDVDGLVSVYVGDNAEPTTGAPVFSFLPQQGRYGTLPQVNRMIPFQAVFANRGAYGGWGVALTSPIELIGSIRGNAVDNGVATDTGALACLHVLRAAESDAYAISLEGSSTGEFTGEESTLATFTSNSQTLGSELVKIDGTIPRYVRWTAIIDEAARDRIKIAISLTRLMTGSLVGTVLPDLSPHGLLTDFQFQSADPIDDDPPFLLRGAGEVTGSRWLNLTKADNSSSDIELQSIAWDTDSTPYSDNLPRFIGSQKHEWELLPALLSNASFYFYLPGDDQIFELPVSTNTLSDGYRIAFASTGRPTSVVTNSLIRVLVANSGQSDRIKRWIALGNQPQVFAPPAKLDSPSLEDGNQQVTVSITPPEPSGLPITTYELRYREAGTAGNPTHIANLSGEPYIVDGLSNQTGYEFSVAAVNRGGRGEWSEYATGQPQS